MLGISACRDDSTGLDAPTTFATVVFSYSASTSTDPSVAAMHSQCVQGVNVTHLHAGWHNFQVFRPPLRSHRIVGRSPSPTFRLGPSSAFASVIPIHVP